MQYLLLVIKYFPYVLQAVMAIESTIGNAVPGTDKKQIVLDSVLAALGVAKTVDNQVVQVISNLIDSIVGSLNAIGVFSHKPTPGTSNAPITK